METATEEMVNRIEVTGLLQQQVMGRGKDQKETLLIPFRGRGGVAGTQVSLLVPDERGRSLVLRLAVPGAIENVDNLGAGDMVTLTGYLAWQQRYDTRFATDEHESGRSSREMELVIQTFRQAEEDAFPEAYVELTGTVVNFPPPLIRPHELFPAQRVALIQVDVVTRVPARRSGMTWLNVARIPVSLPLDLENVPVALRPTNVITVRGRLEQVQRRLNAERDGVVQAALTEWGSDWDQLSARAGSGEVKSLEQWRQQQSQKRRVYLEQDRMLQVTMLRVEAGSVTLVNGEPLSVADAQDARRKWARERFRGSGGSQRVGSVARQPDGTTGEERDTAPSGTTRTRPRKRTNHASGDREGATLDVSEEEEEPVQRQGEEAVP